MTNETKQAAAAAAKALLASGRTEQSPELPEAYSHLVEKEIVQDRQLKLAYANWLRWLLGAQLAIADAVFIVYAWAGRGWQLDPAVIDVWLGATVVQVVGIVLVVTRHLFPLRDGGQQRPTDVDGGQPDLASPHIPLIRK
jgi:hypothetical protein